MKLNYIKILAFTIFASILTSCDLDTSPTTSVENKETFKNTKNAEFVLRGAWNTLFNSGSTYASIGIGSSMLNDDFAGSDVIRPKTYGFSDSYALTFGYARGEYNSVLWSIMYKAINNSNAIIAYIDNAEGTQNDKDRIKGQAYATRAFAYMYLASHFSFAINKDPNAVCVPIYTEPTSLDVALTGNPASSVSEVYTQALNDIEEALKLIPENYSKGTDAKEQHMIDHLTLLGIAARTNLYARNWQKAYEYAEAALAKNSYLMTEDEYKTGFNDVNNKEWIWGVTSTTTDNLHAYVFHFKDTTSPESYYTCLTSDPWLKEMIEDGDYRKDLFEWGQNGYQDWVMLNYKFRFRDTSNKLGDLVMMRTSELYLIKAEAAANIGGKETVAQETLQILRDARMKKDEKGNPVSAKPVTQTGQDLIDEIWKERRIELWGEGFSLTDIIRNQQSVVRKQYETTIQDEDGKDIIVRGHTLRLTLPDGSDFKPNSIYYLFRITVQEELQNSAIYSKYPKLKEYDQM